MRALVTGGAGFIGSHLVQGLLSQGAFVRVLDNFSSGKRLNLAGLQGDLEILEGDLRDKEIVRSAVGQIEYIFHLGAFVSVPGSMQDPQSCFDVNVGGTVNLFEAARQAGVRKVVISSSAAVYGNTDTFPTDEKTSLQPASPYALSKVVNEQYAQLYTHVFGLPVLALRYFNVYGPRQRPDSDYAAAISIFTRRLANGETITIFGDGKQSRDFIYVKDVVRANLLASESDISGEAINICTGCETNLLDLMEELSQISPRPLEARFEKPRPGDIYRSIGDPKKASDLLGFHFQTSLAQGLSQTIDWMKDQEG